MELLKTVADYVASAAAEAKIAAAGSQQGNPLSLSYNSIMMACAQRHPGIVKASWFEDMFNFVINVGGSSGQLIPHILEYDRRWVDHPKRSLPPGTWGVLNQLPADFPHVKVALVMRAYSQEPKGGQCSGPEPTWQHTDRARLQDLRVLLGYFRRILAPAAAEATSQEQGAILIARAILSATESFTRRALS